jgi:hypothetical protein
LRVEPPAAEGLGGTTQHTRRLEGRNVGSVIKKRRKRMAKKKHRKLLKRTRIQRRRQGK